jgi:hypothetical protein
MDVAGVSNRTKLTEDPLHSGATGLAEVKNKQNLSVVQQ